jgi:uncharacterized protein
MYIAEHELKLIKDILVKYIPNAKVLIFGSRLAENHKKHSDIDLCIIAVEKLSLYLLANLREAFAESDLIVRVDLVDWHSISDDFQKDIMSNCYILQDSKVTP